jgi:group I intron endonuclease
MALSMTNVGIYKIASPTGKVYIGQSWDLNARRKAYSKAACKGQHLILNSLLKYGWENHKWEILLYLTDNTTQKWMDYWEISFISFYKDCGLELLNIKPGGFGGKLTEEIKIKISLANKGRKPAQHLIEKLKIINRRPCLEHVKKIVSETHKGVKHHAATPVKQFDKEGNFLAEWSYMKEAAKALDISRTSIGNCCTGVSKSAGGFIWKYKTEN